MRRPFAPSRSRAAAITARTSATVAFTAESCSNAGIGASPRRCGRASSCRCPAARRGSSSRRGPPRSRGGGPSLRRGSAAGRRARRASRGRRRAASGACSAIRADAASENRSPMPKVCSRDVPRRGRPAAPGAHSRRHRQPAGERDSGRGAASRLPRGEQASRASSTPAIRHGRTSSRGSRALGTGPSLLLLSHTDTVLADPSEWTVDPWSGELQGRLRVGPRRARHEGPGGGERRRHRLARARGLSARRRPALRRDGRRGGGRGRRSRACNGCARSTPRRCAATTR